MSARIVIVGNGLLEKEILNSITRTDYCIGVDYAAYWLIHNGRIPEVAIGDFDSTTLEQFKEIKKRVHDVIRFSPEKDFTDMELAVRHALRRKPGEIILYGALGKRLDQTLANVGLLEEIEQAGIRGWIRDQTTRATVISNSLILTMPARYISVLSITKEVKISLKGFKYGATGKVIHRGQTIGVSNELIADKGTIVVERGKVLVIIALRE